MIMDSIIRERPLSFFSFSIENDVIDIMASCERMIMRSRTSQRHGHTDGSLRQPIPLDREGTISI